LERLNWNLKFTPLTCSHESNPESQTRYGIKLPHELRQTVKLETTDGRIAAVDWLKIKTEKIKER